MTLRELLIKSDFDNNITIVLWKYNDSMKRWEISQKILGNNVNYIDFSDLDKYDVEYYSLYYTTVIYFHIYVKKRYE